MITIQAQSNVPTDFGMFTVSAFSENENAGIHIWFGWLKKQILMKLLMYVSIRSALSESFFIPRNVNADNNWMPQ